MDDYDYMHGYDYKNTDKKGSRHQDDPWFQPDKGKKPDVDFLRWLSDGCLIKMRMKFAYAQRELEEGRWIRFFQYDEKSEAHDLVGLVCHTRDYSLDIEEENCIKLLYVLVDKTGHKARTDKFSNYGIYDLKKFLITWNDYRAQIEDVQRIIMAAKMLVEAQLKTRNVVFGEGVEVA